MANAQEKEYIHTQTLFNLLKIEGSLSDRFRTKINEQAKFFIKNAKLLHDLDAKVDSEEDILAIVEVAPEIIELEPQEDFYGEEDPMPKPVHCAAQIPEAIPLVPLLAEIGVQLGMVDTSDTWEDSRGGLLEGYIGEGNVFELLLQHRKEHGVQIFEALEELREKGLFTKQDIHKFGLLDKCVKRYDELWSVVPSLINCDPEILKTWRSSGNDPMFHKLIDGVEASSFGAVLKAALRHYPEELGLMFQLDSEGDTVLKNACSAYGTDSVLEIFEKCITKYDDSIFQIIPEKNIYPFMLAAADGADKDSRNKAADGWNTEDEENYEYYEDMLGWDVEYEEARYYGTMRLRERRELRASIGDDRAKLNIIYHLLRLEPTVVQDDIRGASNKTAEEERTKPGQSSSAPLGKRKRA